MQNNLLRSVSFVLILLAVGVAAPQIPPKGAQGVPPPPRSIPGVTARDLFPHACVDCHVNYVAQKMDVRLSTLMKKWNEKVEPALLKKAAGAAPPGLTLKGKHPAAPGALKNIPAGCLTCHGRASRMAPPFSRMLHAIHLTGGKENHFLTLFQGECTHCHKLNSATGTWSLPSGPEK